MSGIKNGTVKTRDLEKKLDRVFSEFVRLSAADDNGVVKCFTCGNCHHWKETHCGHFIPRARKATRYSETNCHPQCVRCNIYRHGEPDIYRQRLTEMYGKEAVEKLEADARLGGNYDAYALQMLINEYTAKVKQLKTEAAVKRIRKEHGLRNAQ